MSAFDRPPREVYLRQLRHMCCLTGATIDVGLEWRGEDLRGAVAELLLMVDREHETDSARSLDAISLATNAEARIIERWPDRAYFVEAWTGNDESGFIQIFQPFGVPRNHP